jgi:hypothetical protein
MADLDELLARMAKDAALLNAYHEWEMPAPAPAEAINYASVADRIERAAAAIASLREARDEARAALRTAHLTMMMTFAPQQYCECQHPVIRCDASGCNCQVCHLPERPTRARAALSPTQKPGNGE